MIRSIHLKNFFSFYDCMIPLHPNVNILIGINGSGKSNMLKAIKLLKEGIAGSGYKEMVTSLYGGLDSIYHYSQTDGRRAVEIEFEFDSEVLSRYGFYFSRNVFYKIELKRVFGTANYFLKETLYQPPLQGEENPWKFLEFENGRGFVSEKTPNMDRPNLVRYADLDGQQSVLNEVSDPDRFLPIYVFKKAVADFACYEIFDTRLRSKLRQPISPTGAQRLSPEGDNLPQILNTIRINDKDQYRDIIALLNKINDHYSNIDFNPIGGNIELLLDEKLLKKSVHAAHISDGTLQFLCLLSILKNSNAGNLITIDEPEVRLHPDMINRVADCINESSQQRQIIIASHSSDLLDNFNLENVRVFEKDENNATTVKQFSEEAFADWYEDFSVGKMWRKNDLGGNTW